ncbi:hypothetical protein GCM10010166_19500 [Couchioplanes caeruleus subsp. azureus]|nr:hypothetical protein GCM10010166_19500 [Couchioplanes caeruleus subsp. azureus]
MAITAEPFTSLLIVSTPPTGYLLRVRLERAHRDLQPQKSPEPGRPPPIRRWDERTAPTAGRRDKVRPGADHLPTRPEWTAQPAISLWAQLKTAVDDHIGRSEPVPRDLYHRIVGWQRPGAAPSRVEFLRAMEEFTWARHR